jgi:translocator protein
MKLIKEKNMNKNILRQILVVLAVVATLVVNTLANALPINGLNTGQISDAFKVFFVPAGYVFSIWGLIYLGLSAYAVFQALPSQKENPRLQKIGGWFLLGSLANIAWIFLWHYQQFPVTLLAMFTLLVSLIVVYLKLGIGTGLKVTFAETWMVRVPFSLYLGWITVATIANVTDVLYYANWGGWGIAPQVWAVVMLGVAVIVAGLMAFLKRDAVYLAVLVWAFAGIAVKFQGTNPVYLAALMAAVLVALLVVYSLIMNLRKR